MRSAQQVLAMVVVTIVTVAVSCTEPLGILLDGTFEVTGFRSPVKGTPPGLEYEPTFDANGNDGTLTVDGSFWGDGCGERLEWEFFRDGSELVFRLVFVEEIANPACLTWVVVSDYTAEFQGVPPGTYELRVIHDHRRADSVRRFDIGEVTVR